MKSRTYSIIALVLAAVAALSLGACSTTGTKSPDNTPGALAGRPGQF